jgi:hypothetical protein
VCASQTQHITTESDDSTTNEDFCERIEQREKVNARTIYAANRLMVLAEESKLGDSSFCAKERFLNCSFRNHTYRTQIAVLPFRP